MGLWQFMPATGSHYQLRITDWVDERQDPAKSTEAALTHLQQLYGVFGDWFLALAAYNAGEDRVKREMARQGVSSFFDLVLPSETERYLFRIAAAKVILSEPARYGFELESGELYEPAGSERVGMSVGRDLDLVAMAQGVGMTYRALRSLNPQIRNNVLPKGEYDIYVPSGKAGEITQFLGKWNSAAASGEPGTSATKVATKNEGVGPRGGRVIHTVQAGETLSTIAQKHKVAVKSIQEWNNLGGSDQIRPGQRLTIHR
jgi:hypothetical protein